MFERRETTAAACLLLIAASLLLSACGKDEDHGEEPSREGIAIPVGGIDYNVFITRQLNPRITPDDAYVSEEAPPGEALYGVFIQVCNSSDELHPTADRFAIVDNQHNRFEPEPLPADNQFAYHPRPLAPKECIPEAGSVAQLGPTAGSMLLFRLPLQNTENRPLELEVEGRGDEKLTFELDI